MTIDTETGHLQHNEYEKEVIKAVYPFVHPPADVVDGTYVIKKQVFVATECIPSDFKCCAGFAQK